MFGNVDKVLCMDLFYGIYGVGAIVIILFSQYFNKNNFILFVFGFGVGSGVEYMISFFTELLLKTQWWDYTGYVLNLNGRICLLYSIFWGLLTVFLVRKINPKIDRAMNNIRKKFPSKVLKAIVLVIIAFLFLDCIITCVAQEAFIVRLVKENEIAVDNQEKFDKKYESFYKNEKVSDFIYRFWGDEKMIRTFPNIKISDKDGNIIYLDSLLPDIQPYYLKVFDK